MTQEIKKNGSRPAATLFRALDFLLVRAPLLPIERYQEVHAAVWLRNGLPTLAPVDPQVRRALAIGSPSLLDALERTAPDDEKAARLIGKLRRFLIRMSTRPTPYGTFAGVALARWGKDTDLLLDAAPRTRTRVDMDWLVQYVMTLDAQPAIRKQLQWIANSAAWIYHDRAILSERMPSVTAGPSGTVSIAATPVVRRVFDLARTPSRYDELVEQLTASTPSATPEKVERLLGKMWELGFLRTELMPPVTVEDPVRWLRDRVAPITGGKALCVQLDALLRTVAACDTVAVEEVPKALRKATAHLQMLGRSRTEMPLQVDMALGLSGAHLSSTLAEEAARTADLLLRLTPAPAGPPSIEGYRQAFVGRYGKDREVPLLELLRPELGLGPIGQHYHAGTRIDPGLAARRAETLQYLALRAIRDGQHVVELDETLLGMLETQRPTADQLPTSIDLNLFVLAESRAAIDSGSFQLMVGPNVGASSAGRNLARFSPLLGQPARIALERAARNDENYCNGKITAELAFLPRDFRTANVTIRPAVRSYEIVHGLSAGVDADHVIPLNELVVGLHSGHFYVRWLTHDVDVLFASGHMLNPSQAPPEYQFLSEISRDGIAQLTSFDWGPASGYVFLPRVQSGRSILQCAQWRLQSSGQKEAPVDKAKPFAEWLARWCERWLVPRRVYLSWADNRLLYDLEDPAQVEDLRSELRSTRVQGQCLLQEALPGPEHAWLPSADGGHHIVELTVSLGLRSDPSKQSARSAERQVGPLVTPDVRLRPPGSDWLYLKLYGPRSGEDEMLAGAVRALCREIDDVRMADEWFFVRYADPESHVRLRFRAAPRQLTGMVFPRLCAWASKLVSDGRCQKFAFDTYEREVERYGGHEATVAAEALFAADSRAVLDLLASPAAADRMTLVVVTIDDLLRGLGLDDSARLALLKQTVTSRKEVSEEYRARRDRLITVLSDPAQFDAAVSEALARRRTALKQVAARLDELKADGNLTLPLSKLYESYVHMHCNRLWGDQAGERRALGLLLRLRDAIAHRPRLNSKAQSATNDGDGGDPLPSSHGVTVVDDSAPLVVPHPLV